MGFRVVGTTLLGCLLCIPAFAANVTKSDLAKCSAEKDKIKRLECFDSIAERVGAAKPKVTKPVAKGNWQARKETSPLDDSINFYLQLESDNTIPNRYGGTVRPVMTIRCKENTTALTVWWGVYLGLDSTYVTHRIGKSPARTTEWSLSTKNEHIGKWYGSSSIPFIKSLLNESELLFQVTPYGENSVMASFSIAGLNEAIKPLRTQCGW